MKDYLTYNRIMLEKMNYRIGFSVLKSESFTLSQSKTASFYFKNKYCTVTVQLMAKIALS